MRRWIVLVAALALAGCGVGVEADSARPDPVPAEPEAAPGPAAAPAEETAQLWVTRDRGATVLLSTTVPAGLTAVQALDREAEIDTRYGGRYVQSVNGVEGTVEQQADWFYFVNGIEPDVGGAEIRLHPGDIVWWDYRSWEAEAEAPVVVGAFPEPYLHGFDGNVRPVDIEAPPALDAVAKQLERLLSPASSSGEPNVFALEITAGAVEGATLTATRGPGNDSPVRFALSGSAEAVRSAALSLVETPGLLRFRYTATFDRDGRLRG
jgi:Domain of unknown function (DUF4430)